MIMKYQSLIFLLLFIMVNSLLAQEETALRGVYLGQNPPGDAPELFAPGIVSTGKEHSAAMFTPDGNEIWFARLLPSAIYFMKYENGKWTKPQIASFSGRYDDLYPHLSFNGNKIIFCSRRPIEKNGKILPRGQGHLWMVERNENGWSESRHLGRHVNSSVRQGASSLTKNGTLYFNCKNNEQPEWSMDIYRARLVNGQYEKPENLGEPISSKTPDHSPFIAPDESYLIFSSFRPGGYGMSDLYISYRNTDGSWTMPKNLGSKINSSAKDEYPYISPDSNYLFFNSNRLSVLNENKIPDGPGNIYWVSAKFIDELRTEIFK